MIGDLKIKGELAKEVIDGKWSNGDERKKRLSNAGYDYDVIQEEVNKLMNDIFESGSMDRYIRKIETLKELYSKLSREIKDLKIAKIGNVKDEWYMIEHYDSEHLERLEYFNNIINSLKWGYYELYKKFQESGENSSGV